MYPIVHQLFGHMQCYHPKGTHRKLKGVDADGRGYLTAATENYSTGTNRLIARCVHWRLSGTIAGVCESEYEHMPPMTPEEGRPAELAAIASTTSSPTSESLPLPPGLRWRDVAATPDDVEAHVTLDAGSFGLVGRRSARSGSSGARFGQWYFINILHANVRSWVTYSEVGASSADVAPR